MPGQLLRLSFFFLKGVMKKNKYLKRIFICSPLRGAPDLDPEIQNLNVARNLSIAAMLCLFASKDGAAPFAPHLFYPQFLNDACPNEREAGTRAGLSFLQTCAEMWVYTELGISEGMHKEILAANAMGIKVIFDPPCFGSGGGCSEQ